MNKVELIKSISSYSNFGCGSEVSQKQVAVVLEALAEQAKKTLSAGGELTIPGIGKLSTGERAERKGRNPKTGEEITISAAKVAKFKPSKVLKDALN